METRRSSFLLLVSSLLLCFFFPGIIASGVVTLRSLQIFTDHSWIPFKHTVYFSCQGENQTILPDVTTVNSLYTFKGEESWQPLTDLPDEKCKRCGLYESDNLQTMAFDEWELCRDDFVSGEYVHFKENEFNASFICSACVSSKSSSHAGSKKKTSLFLPLILIILVCTVVALALVAGYKYWRKKKREQDHARFLQLFEEGDDLEDELDLGLGRL